MTVFRDVGSSERLPSQALHGRRHDAGGVFGHHAGRAPDFIHWIVSARQSETRARRITNACDMLAKGKRRPCCFDRSGMYGKSLSCPASDGNFI